MNVLVTGRGTSGSWKIRGEQLGRTIGADVIPDARDVARYDVAILVKRTRGDLVERIHAAGVPLVWDVVDAWPQPEGNRWDWAECLSWFGDQVKRLRPRAVIAATRRMAEDIATVTDAPVITLPHHGRPGLRRTEIRERLSVIAYEGGVAQLGAWGDHLLRICAKRGITVLLNPPSVNDADVLVALREADGYAARHWKSNVKLANAQASGTPIICGRESGYVETAGESWPVFVDTPEGLAKAIDLMVSRETRQRLSEGLYGARINLVDVARRYRDFLEATCCPARSS